MKCIGIIDDLALHGEFGIVFKNYVGWWLYQNKTTDDYTNICIMCVFFCVLYTVRSFAVYKLWQQKTNLKFRWYVYDVVLFGN